MRRLQETEPGTVTATLERGGATIMLKSVLTEVCANRGEEYVDEETTRRLLAEVGDAVGAGVQLEVRTYRAP